jgi:hypothetical protein
MKVSADFPVAQAHPTQDVRLPEAKIKDAILHPEKLVRHEALFYFAECSSRDTEVMPLVVQAIQKYGRRNAFLHNHFLANLAQTEATVDWAIRELHHEEDKFEDHDSYFPGLSRLLCQADPQLVAPRAKEILQAPGFLKQLTSELEERLRLATWDADQCWKELERICTEGAGKDVDFGHASRVVEALARNGEKYVDNTLDLLGKKVEDFTDPMSWLEIFLVMLAREMRLVQAVPLVVKKLHESDDAEVLWEQCVDALGKIGTDAAAEAVTEGWLESTWDYRLYATSALEKIHSDSTVRTCLELLPQEKDVGIRTKLADVLLSQFAEDAIEPVREMVQKRAFDPVNSDLMSRLAAVSTILGVTFPEYPIWKREAEERQAKQERRMKEMNRFFQAPASPSPRKPDEVLERKPAPIVRTEKKVGRNDPCPCHSGKKYKKCCMSR